MKNIKVRPQIIVAMVILGVIGVLGLLEGYNEIATASAVGITGLGMKLLENE